LNNITACTGEDTKKKKQNVVTVATVATHDGFSKRCITQNMEASRAFPIWTAWGGNACSGAVPLCRKHSITQHSGRRVDINAGHSLSHPPSVISRTQALQHQAPLGRAKGSRVQRGSCTNVEADEGKRSRTMGCRMQTRTLRRPPMHPMRRCGSAWRKVLAMAVSRGGAGCACTSAGRSSADAASTAARGC